MNLKNLNAIQKIGKERLEHFFKHGRLVYDDRLNNDKGQLAHAAIVLLQQDQSLFNAPEAEPDRFGNERFDFGHVAPQGWDKAIFNKMMNKSYEERLVIAGALIAAEIDRLDTNTNFGYSADETFTNSEIAHAIARADNQQIRNLAERIFEARVVRELDYTNFEDFDFDTIMTEALNAASIGLKTLYSAHIKSR